MAPSARARLAAIALVVLAPAAAPLAAQERPLLAADVGVHSAYVWRGISLTNRPVVQPAVSLSLPAFGGAWTVGGFASIEPARYDGLRDLSQSGGAAAMDVAEYDAWLEYGRSVGPMALTLGATTYRFPNASGSTAASNTVEAYGTVALAVPLSPTVGVWYDVDAVRGAYVEASVSHDVHALLAVPLTVGAAAGFNAGQELTLDPAQLANFAERGMTHAALSLSSSLGVGPIAVEPAAHVVFARDAATRLAEPGRERGTKLWFGTTLSWASGARR